MGIPSQIVDQTEVWVVWVPSSVGAGPLTCGVCANCAVNVRIAFELLDSLFVSEYLLVFGKNNHTTYYTNNFILDFYNIPISYVVWSNTRIMHITPVSTSEIMIFEVYKVKASTKYSAKCCWDYFPPFIIIIRKCGRMNGHKIELTCI